MLASTLGIGFNLDESWDDKKETLKISGKIVGTRNIRQSSIVINQGYTTVIAAAVFVLLIVIIGAGQRLRFVCIILAPSKPLNFVEEAML